MKLVLQEVGYGVSSTLVTDSHGLLDTTTTEKLARDKRSRRTIQRIRDSFVNKDIDEVRWIPGTENVADAGTKSNQAMWRKVSRCFEEGVLPVDLSKDTTARGEEWREA